MSQDNKAPSSTKSTDAKPLIEGPKLHSAAPTKGQNTPTTSANLSSDVKDTETPSLSPGRNVTAVASDGGEDATTKGPGLNTGDASSGVWAKMYQWMKDHPIASCGLGALAGAVIAAPILAVPLAPVIVAAAVGAAVCTAGYYAGKAAVKGVSAGWKKLKNGFSKKKEDQEKLLDKVESKEVNKKESKTVDPAPVMKATSRTVEVPIASLEQNRRTSVSTPLPNKAPTTGMATPKVMQ